VHQVGFNGYNYGDGGSGDTAINLGYHLLWICRSVKKGTLTSDPLAGQSSGHTAHSNLGSNPFSAPSCQTMSESFKLNCRWVLRDVEQKPDLSFPIMPKHPAWTCAARPRLGGAGRGGEGRGGEPGGGVGVPRPPRHRHPHNHLPQFRQRAGTARRPLRPTQAGQQTPDRPSGFY
jgi:hypothetical protein